MLDRFLGALVPVWLVLALMLLMISSAVVFGWLVREAVLHEDEGRLSRAAVKVAAFPSDVKRVAAEVDRALTRSTDYSGLYAVPHDDAWKSAVAVPSATPVGIEGIMVRRGTATPVPGWRVLVGAFRIDGEIRNAAVMISPDLRIVHHWPLEEDGAVATRPQPIQHKFIHGFAILPDGSAIYSFDNGVSLHKKDLCGRTEWVVDGSYHHAVTADDEGRTVWTLRDEPEGEPPAKNRLVQIDVEEGRILRDISLADIIAANPDIDVLELRRPHGNDPGGNSAELPGRWLEDPFHLNDVDPLPAALADRFPMFAAGDLLVSAREINLVFVVDPQTLALKWWRVGATIRQHDPDWQPNGRITVYNNRMTRGYSEIVEIDPVTFARTVLVDGRQHGFYSRIRGKHQVLPDGGMLITASQQGRTLELSADGEMALEFHNVLDEAKPVLGALSEAMFFPADAFDIGGFRCRVS